MIGTKNYRFQIILIGIAVSGALILFLLLFSKGINVNPDSVYYFSVARNIYAGNGLTGYDGFPLILQPPLYPYLLLVLKIISMLNFITISEIFNALLYGGTIYISGVILQKYLQSLVMVMAGIFLIITSSILLKIYLSALSEPLFIFLSLLFLYFIEEYFIKNNFRLLLLISFITAAAIMTRYIGVIILAAGIIRFFVDGERFSKKKIYALITYLLISSLPGLIWITRNYIISQSPMGSRAASSFTLKQNISLSYNSISEWFRIPEYYNGYLIPAGIFISGVFVLAFLFQRKNQLYPMLRSRRSIITFILIYLGTLIIASSMFAYDKIGDRLLSPVYIPLIILLVSAADKFLLRKIIYLKIAIAIGTLLLMNFSVQKYYFLIDDYLFNSGWEYSSRSWSENTVIRYIEKMNKGNYRFYSNAPDAVYFFTKKEARWSPLKTFYNSNVEIDKKQSLYEMGQKEKKYLIWFDNVHRSFLYSKAELNSLFHLRKISKLTDGEIFEITYD